MSRRRRAEKRDVIPDPKYTDPVVSKFMNNLMKDGKKSAAERIVYGAFDQMEAKAKQDPIALFHQALENVMPAIEVRSRRVGGATYQVPVDLSGARAQRKHNGGSPFRRTAGCVKQPWNRRQEARGHAPDG